jgi:hypothetical protein
MLIQHAISNKRHYGTSLHCKIMHPFNKASVKHDSENMDNSTIDAEQNHWAM